MDILEGLLTNNEPDKKTWYVLFCNNFIINLKLYNYKFMCSQNVYFLGVKLYVVILFHNVLSHCFNIIHCIRS